MVMRKNTVGTGVGLLMLAWAVLSPNPHPALAEDSIPALTAEKTYAAAIEKAQKENRLVFLEFMSATCSHCQAFKKAVLDTELFQRFAEQNLSLVFYDVAKSQGLSSAERKVYDHLIRKHKVQYTPTIVILDADGEVLLRTVGYKKTPVEKIIANLKSLAKSK